jgi:hypothetical protein
MRQRGAWSTRLWNRLGIVSTRDAAARAEQASRRLERHEKRIERANERLDQHEQQSSAVAETMAELRTSVAKLQQVAAAAGDQARMLALARKQDLASLDAVAGLAAELEQSAAAIAAHVERAISSAVVSADPFPHVVIDELLPAAFYDRILAVLPPTDYWRSSGRARDYWEVETDVGPWETEAVWRFVNRQIVDRTLRPRLVQAFRGHLEDYWRDGFGVDGACVRYHTAEGRLQRRGKGYLLRPHLDPPHAALTGLFYLARPGDDPRYGTGFYKPSTPLPTRRKGIFYPEEHGIALENVRTVPFQANTLVVWMTSLGPHGADLTAPDVPASIARYTYQFQLVTDADTRRRLNAKS